MTRRLTIAAAFLAALGMWPAAVGALGSACLVALWQAPAMREPRWVAYTPYVTTGVFQAANLAQIHRMVSQQTAAGQSATGWLLVHAGLWLWLNYYEVCTPEARSAARATRFSLVVTALLFLTVLYYS